MDKQDYELDRREHFVLILSTAVVAVLLVVTVVGILKLDPAAPQAGTYT